MIESQSSDMHFILQDLQWPLFWPQKLCDDDFFYNRLVQTHAKMEFLLFWTFQVFQQTSLSSLSFSIYSFCKKHKRNCNIFLMFVLMGFLCQIWSSYNTATYQTGLILFNSNGKLLDSCLLHLTLDSQICPGRLNLGGFRID